MLLRNQDQYRDLLQIDVTTDVRQRIRLGKGDQCATDGSFFEQFATLFGLGVESGELYVILSGRLFLWGATLTTQLQQSPDQNTFTAIRDSQKLCTVRYTPIKASGWIPNEDDECLDGFLWIHNVLCSPERRAILIANDNR